MRQLFLFSLVILAACATEQSAAPTSLGEVVGAAKSDAVPGDESVSFIQWKLPDDSVTTDISFRLLMLHDDKWLPDVYNYTQRPLPQRPVTSTIQQTVELCWVELLNGDTISAGAVPDTDGEISFRLAYGKDLTGSVVNLRCDLSEDAEPLTIGVAFEKVTLYGPYISGEGFVWYGSYFDIDSLGIKTTVTIE